ATTPDDPTIDAGLVQMGTLSWKKVDSNGQPLAGSVWTLTAKVVPGTPAGTVLNIVDCVAATATACTGPDQDPAAGSLNVSGLAYGTYDLTEVKAPTGFKILSSPISVTISAPATVIPDVTNVQQTVPAIPLTGGLGSDLYAIVAGLLLALTAGLVLTEFARRRRPNQ
ncbi:prealbumin-like fold domain-containing protein, partial [Psychromicrobium xiongbiense]|uniref:prealbumin-like fold domain-containing protein n=1 Tax=Psychromicrobium xiongbiense TaxID=3051184 RepID=UPI002557A257